MKKYLLPCDVNWYRANLHCHSTISDGNLTVEEIKSAYTAQGYSIVAFTDHEILLDHSYLNDDSFLALTSSEYSITESTPSINDVEGYDIDNWRRSKTIHMCIFSKKQHNTFQPAADDSSFAWVQGGKYVGKQQCDNYHREYTRESINETVKRCNDAGFLVQLNHPYWSLNTREDYLAIEGLWSLEILNYATERLTGAEYCPYIYDDMIREGMHSLFCTMGDDNHNRGGNFDGSFGGSTFIGAKELKYDRVIEAMEKGDIYCASGKNPPRITSLYVENNKVYVDCTPADNIIYTGYARHYLHEYGDGITHAEFPISKNDVMFRITVRDKLGGNAHTHYYNVNDYLDKE
ncbi:MAG: hypothetical protein J6B34_04845 [Clostridia bacterium]|nr:hypothetical protein [Clostridia bacterium]